MVCKRWESDGLLYVAGELSEDAAAQYRQHLLECKECEESVADYENMFAGFAMEDLLTETPSAECDAKILAAMEAAAEEKAKPVISMGGVFTMLFQRVAIPLAIFAFAVTVGIRITSQTAGPGTEIAKSIDTVVEEKDSTDVSIDSGRIFIQGGGEGVIPVTLEE